MRHALTAMVLLCAFLGAPPAVAQSLGWMKGEAAGFFTDRDWRLLSEAIDAALDGTADGEAHEWRNERSGAHGRITPLASDTRDGVTCRRVRIESHARGASSSHRYLFCREGEAGAWSLGMPRKPAAVTPAVP